MQVPALNLKAEVLYDERQPVVTTRTAAQQREVCISQGEQHTSNGVLIFY